MCYDYLDNETGEAIIGSKLFGIAVSSKSGQAPVVNDDDYRRFQREAAASLGIDVDQGSK
jgi:hypothetical protein